MWNGHVNILYRSCMNDLECHSIEIAYSSAELGNTLAIYLNGNSGAHGTCYRASESHRSTTFNCFLISWVCLFIVKLQWLVN